MVDLYYSGKNNSLTAKLRSLLKLPNNQSSTFNAFNITSVKEINSRFSDFANKHSNVYYIDRNIPVCITETECLLTKNGIPLYSDAGHLSYYGGEIVGKYILDKMNENK